MKISSNHTAKFVLVGDSGVDKTSFIKRLQTEKFEEKYFQTTVPQVSLLAFHRANEMILFDIWDTSGQERFDGLQGEYYHEINGAYNNGYLCIFSFSPIYNTMNMVIELPHRKHITGEQLIGIVCGSATVNKLLLQEFH